jgi:hypothetical protein
MIHEPDQVQKLLMLQNKKPWNYYFKSYLFYQHGR